MCDTATIQARIRQKKSLPRALEAKPEVEIWRRPVFLTATPPFDLSESRPKYTTTSGFANPLQVWPRLIFTRVFRIMINFTTFRTISGTFESTSGFWTVLPDYRFRFGDNTGQNKAKKSLPGALEAKPEVEIWRKPVFPTQLPRLPIRLRILYGVYLAPLRLHRERILTLAHCNGRGT